MVQEQGFIFVYFKAEQGASTAAHEKSGKCFLTKNTSQIDKVRGSWYR